MQFFLFTNRTNCLFWFFLSALPNLWQTSMSTLLLHVLAFHVYFKYQPKLILLILPIYHLQQSLKYHLELHYCYDHTVSKHYGQISPSHNVFQFDHICHCVKSLRIRSNSGPHFPAFGLIAYQNSFSFFVLVFHCHFGDI